MNIYLNHSRPGARRRRRNRRHGALIIGALVLLALFAVIQIAGHLAVLAVIAAIAISAYYLGRHASRRARPGQAAPPRRQPEMPAAGPAAPMVTLPRTDPGPTGRTRRRTASRTSWARASQPAYRQGLTGPGCWLRR